jgi:hypothetical protein
MNFELTLNKMSRNHGFDFTMQPMAYDTCRAVIPVGSWNQLNYIQNAFARIKGIKTDSWKCFDGCFEGYVYVMESSEYDRYRAESDAESARNWNWWERYNIADAETRRLMACGAIA